MYWLAASTEPSSLAVVEEESTPEAVNATTVAVDELVSGLATYVGTEVRLEGVSVVSRLGPQAFWTTTSTGMPFLIRVTPALAADGFRVDGGESVTVVGRVVMMSDSVLTAWLDEGVLLDENQKMEAEFSVGFVEAHQGTVQASESAADGGPGSAE